MHPELTRMFARLQQVSTLDFQAQSLDGSQMAWNHQARGDTQTVFSDGILTFRDRFRLDNGRLCRDEKQWRLEDGGLAFYHYRHQAFEQIFLFRIQDNAIRADKPYACMPDDYFGTLTWRDNAVVLTIEIRGTRKNEVIRYTYR
ncbi:hypothetical protein J2T38_001100 [Neisseria perflava]|uniref:DUF6314 family protein n=1 Tax=Neisseria perflava TaxID=33053 RepID=UPI00209CD9B3|nr:DUF6314 family protein [Neisseria perflava]MCP1772277.1 hypothetical protein [Neisseria perflava]